MSKFNTANVARQQRNTEQMVLQGVGTTEEIRNLEGGWLVRSIARPNWENAKRTLVTGNDSEHFYDFINARLLFRYNRKWGVEIKV